MLSYCLASLSGDDWVKVITAIGAAVATILSAIAMHRASVSQKSSDTSSKSVEKLDTRVHEIAKQMPPTNEPWYQRSPPSTDATPQPKEGSGE